MKINYKLAMESKIMASLITVNMNWNQPKINDSLMVACLASFVVIIVIACNFA